MLIKNRIHGPDVLRGFAAVGIVFFHVLYMSGLPINEMVRSVVGRFDFFVRLFFVISAFSMTYAYRERLNSLNDIRWFYLKRFFRIAPLFYFVIALNTVISISNSRALPSFYDFLLSVTFLFPFTPGKIGGMVGGGWSIGIEWLFYAFFPLITSFIHTCRLALIVSIPFVIIAILGHEHFGFYLDGKLRVYGLLFLLSHIQYFIVGIAAYHLFSDTAINFHSKQINGFLVILIFSFIVIHFKFLPEMPEEVVLTFGSFFLVYLSSHGLPSYLDNIGTRYLGQISYSVYLMQFPIIHAFRKHGVYSYIANVVKGDLTIFAISSLATIITILIVSAVTFRYIEKPGAKLITLFSHDEK